MKKKWQKMVNNFQNNLYDNKITPSFKWKVLVHFSNINFHNTVIMLRVLTNALWFITNIIQDILNLDISNLDILN